ncbi:hypothetical protein JTE90_019972, partial [Oedothorax gibbosus]
ETQTSLHFQFRMGIGTICGILMEVCTAIFSTMRADVIPTPSTEEEWREISSDFWELWNFPHCIGAMDGKHIKISPPPNSGSIFFNYKGDFSLVLLALVDAKLKFTFVDVGTNGRISDGGVWDKCALKAALSHNNLQKPNATVLPGTRVKVPSVIVADDAFPLTTTIMKPYPGRGMSHEERIFNYRLSRARRVSENAFGILANRFRLFQTTIYGTPAKVKAYVLAACCLHNFLRMRILEREGMDAIQGEQLMTETENSEWQQRALAFVPLQRGNWRGNQQAKLVRHKFTVFQLD